MRAPTCGAPVGPAEIQPKSDRRTTRKTAAVHMTRSQRLKAVPLGFPEKVLRAPRLCLGPSLEDATELDLRDVANVLLRERPLLLFAILARHTRQGTCNKWGKRSGHPKCNARPQEINCPQRKSRARLCNVLRALLAENCRDPCFPGSNMKTTHNAENRKDNKST